MKRETTKAGPTPGPWTAHDEGTGMFSILAGESTVAMVAQMNPRSDEDARLIAAAPDTYAALRGLMLGRWGVRIDAEDPETAATLRAALSRAEGKGGGK